MDVTTKTLTDDELATVIDYAEQIGRRWKAALLLDWYNASSYKSGFDRHRYSVLQGLRNRAGAHDWINAKTTTLPHLTAEQERRKSAPRLVDEATGRELKVGETVTTFRGEKMILTGGQPPRHEGSSGRVYLCPPGARRFTNTAEFYPGVINAKWVQR